MCANKLVGSLGPSQITNLKYGNLSRDLLQFASSTELGIYINFSRLIIHVRVKKLKFTSVIFPMDAWIESSTASIQHGMVLTALCQNNKYTYKTCEVAKLHNLLFIGSIIIHF